MYLVPQVSGCSAVMISTTFKILRVITRFKDLKQKDIQVLLASGDALCGCGSKLLLSILSLASAAVSCCCIQELLCLILRGFPSSVISAKFLRGFAVPAAEARALKLCVEGCQPS